MPAILLVNRGVSIKLLSSNDRLPLKIEPLKFVIPLKVVRENPIKSTRLFQ